MSEKTRQVKNAFLYLVPVAVGNLVPLATLPVFTRILSREDYGLWALAQVYAVFAAGLANLGLPIGYERDFFERREGERASELLWSVCLFSAASFALFGALTWMWRGELARLVIGSPEHGGLLFWAFCAAAVLALKQYFLIRLKNGEEAGLYMRFAVADSLAVLAASLFFVAGLRAGPVGLVWGPLAGGGLILAALAAHALRRLPPRLAWAPLGGALSVSAPLVPRTFLGLLGGQLDKYLLGLISTLGGVGIYTIGQRVASVVFVYMSAVENVYSPQVYKRMFDLGPAGGESVGRYLTPFAWVSASVALALALFCEEGLWLLTPPSYHGAIDVVILLSVHYGIMFFGKQPQLIYAKKTWISSALSVVSLALTVALCVPLIRRGGALGAAWGILAAGALSGAAAFALSQRAYPIRWEYRRILPAFALLCAAAPVLIWLRAHGAPYPARLAFKAACLGLCAWLGARSGVLTRENADLLRGLLPLRRAA